MTSDPKRVKDIFLAAAELPDQAAQIAYLEQTCGGDAALRGRVEALLRAHDPAGSFLGTPAVPEASFSPTVMLDKTANGGEATPERDEDLQFLEPPTRPDSLGRIGHYEVLQVLGKGGFGIVFRAFDDQLQRVVAIKVMAPQLAATSPARKRFLREARSSAQVRHENVVHVYAVEEQPLPYLSMEFIPGETLQQRLDRVGPLGPEEIVSLSRQIAQGLAAAHATGLIHRDIKPGNVLIEGGASDRVKITDFGLARAADDASMTQSGMVAGTPMYMAPEQAQGETLDQRADLFSLGSVMYVMASGRPPFRAATTFAVLKRVVEEEPRPIKDLIPETPQWLCDIIARLHAKNPADRFQSAAEVAQALDESLAYLRDPARAPRPKVLVAPASRAPQAANLPPAQWQIGWGWLAVIAAVCLVPALGCLLLIVGLAIPAYQARQADMVRKLSEMPDETKESPLNVLPVSLPPLVVDEWMPLFNGTDFTGWKQDGYWTIENGMLVSRIPAAPNRQPGFLTTDRSDFRDFHLRVEAKINAAGDSGLFFRFGEQGDASLQAQIVPSPNHAGSLLRHATTVVPVMPGTLPIKPDTWFTMEVIAQGPQVEVLVDGQKAAEWSYPSGAVPSGPIALESGFPKTEFMVRKVKVKPLSAAAVSLAHSESLPPTYKNSIGMEFVRVPKGKSWLGGGKDKPGDKEVEFAADFYLGKYEVTQEQWRKVTGKNPSGYSRDGYKDVVKDVSDADLQRFPVENVSINQCLNFVEKLNKLEGESGWEYRLPTELEWEYACRGGPMSDQADSSFDFCLAKPTNTLLPVQANFGDELHRPRQVGSYEPNALGLCDMHGNVGEWCEEWSVRGGGFSSTASDCRAEHLWSPIDGFGNGYTGLRLVRVRLGTPVPEVKTPSPLANAPFTDADVQRITALPAAEQVDEVKQELINRNPDFDGKVGHKVEDGVVTEFRIVTDKVTDVAPIRVFNSLRLLDCRGTWSDRPNGQLANLSRLEGMSLADLQYLHLGHTKVCDADLAIFKNCKRLRKLILWYTKTTDAGLAHFADCKDFTDVDLSYTQVTDAGLISLKDCQAQTRLILPGTKVSNTGLAYFKGIPLKVLWIYQTGITDLTPLQGMPLEEIRLAPKNIIRGLDILRDMKSLKTIGTNSSQAWPAVEFWERYDKGEFGLAPFSDADVQRIAALSAAEQVDEVKKELVRRNPGFDGKVETKIEGDLVTELRILADQVTDISPIRVWSALRVLQCKSRYANGQLADLTSLKGMNVAGLTILDLTDTKVSDAGMVNFRECKNLTELYVVGTQVSDSGLIHFQDCQALTHLYLAGTEVSDVGLAHFKDCKDLKYLSLGHTRAGDAGLVHFKDCKGLIRLYLSRTKVSDAGLAQFNECKNLTHLILDNTQVGDAGLVQFQGKLLKTLAINHTAITDLTPVQGMPLEEIRLTPKNITRGLDILRDMQSLKTIGIGFGSNQSWPAAEFWERYDKGEFKE